MCGSGDGGEVCVAGARFTNTFSGNVNTVNLKIFPNHVWIFA